MYVYDVIGGVLVLPTNSQISVTEQRFLFQCCSQKASPNLQSLTKDSVSDLLPGITETESVIQIEILKKRTL